MLVGVAVFDATVHRGKKGAIVLEHLKAVGTRGCRVETVHIVYVGGFGDRDRQHRVARVEGERATGIGEMYSRKSREAHCAVAHCLRRQVAAAALDGELVAVVFNGERLRPRRQAGDQCQEKK